MKTIFYFFIIISVVACSNTDSDSKNFKSELKEFRKMRNKKMASNSSPISLPEKKNFVGLNFYPANDSFLFIAKFELIFTQEIIEMETNTQRLPKFLPYAKISWFYKGKNLNLTAYKNIDDNTEELFIPFTDETNGNGSYEVGRYIDIEIPDKDRIVLDFNKCYNPYCAYNKKYSCPIPPLENKLEIAVTAGERSFH